MLGRIRIVVLVVLIAGGALLPSGAAQQQAEADDAAFLVVAPRDLCDSLSAYLAHKRGQLATRLVVLETVLTAQDGADDPERLKRYLYAAWRARGTRYVLLVGDADTLPVRYMVLDRVTPAACDYAFYPSDLYYADVAKPDGSFDGWNARRDGFHAGYFGEVRGEKNKQDPINFDRIDYRPELAVGRWPVSTPDEVRTVATKTIRYEQTIRENRHPGARRAALFAVGGWVDARGRMDRMAEMLPAGWTVEKRYYSDDPHNPDTPPPDEGQLVALINAGVGLLLHTGHGTDTRWEHCLSVKTLGRLENADRLPIMLSAGCSTARFATLPPYEAYVDVDGVAHQGTNNGEVFTTPPPPPTPWPTGKYNHTGLGEQLLKSGPNGAVAYFGCNTGSQPCGITLLDGFLATLRAQKQPRLGDCWTGAVRYYYDREKLATIKPTESWYPASIFFQGMKFMLFGDPTLLMPTAKTN
jgi:hypothetical protein